MQHEPYCPVPRAMERGENAVCLCRVKDHEHKWGPIEHARFTGNPHRKCQLDGCKAITLDLNDDDLEELS